MATPPPSRPSSTGSARSRAERASTARSTRLDEKELHWLAAVGPNHHALVAYVDGDPEPVAIARLVRFAATAEIAFEDADAYQGRGIGSALTQELAAMPAQPASSR